jgi:hypothetical protein
LPPPPASLVLGKLTYFLISSTFFEWKSVVNYSEILLKHLSKHSKTDEVPVYLGTSVAYRLDLPLRILNVYFLTMLS